MYSMESATLNAQLVQQKPKLVLTVWLVNQGATNAMTKINLSAYVVVQVSSFI
jgi:hypothetical protein